ncbi:gamma-interferon-inducible lysosomal thiol reductase-like [Pyrus ussuriensis x Pyrus communis]|uniref:Gamma-interferon-inducible lysosomal thiol reductase-like n=1 Tax=Pyrus ussuriensis x Pyrus communis TaxID=2448454 RepID=A0A5N5HUB8_9ROSA|nr:gamma-interferon-inducible lysosomal thiol reductase-like [Pyrus ussuriensis x Pyrus communis]
METRGFWQHETNTAFSNLTLPASHAFTRIFSNSRHHPGRREHGPDECRLDSLEACAIDVLHDVNKHFALIYCIEFLAIEGRHKEWQTCFSSLGLPLKPVLDCYKSANATKLELKYANETAHLSLPLKFVPWLVLNNQPIGNDYENFASYVCKAYKGVAVPMACRSVHLKQKAQ